MYHPDPVTPALFLEGLLAGTFVGSIMLEHTAGRLTLAEWLPYSRAKEASYGAVMPVFFTATLIAAIATAAFGGDRVRWVPAALALAAAGVITARIHLPLNAMFKAWSPAQHPADADALRHRWRRWNVARGALAVVAFALTI